MDNNNTDSDNELCYDSNLSFPRSLASYLTYIYENHAVPHCDSTRESIYSSESISVLVTEHTFLILVQMQQVQRH